MNRKTPDRISLRASGLFIIAVLGAGLVWVLLAPPRASAATFTVTKTADTNDGVCDGDCSLREAIAAANAAPDNDGITLPAGIYTLTLGSLSITSNLTLTGALSSTTIINGMPYYGVLGIGSGSTVTISNLTITGGRSYGAGGIDVEHSAALTLNDSAVVNNAGFLGGGIQNGGTLIINRSAIVGNSAGLFNSGGGIDNQGTLTITESLIAENTSGNGGGLYNYGTTLILTSTIRDNIDYKPYGGGGIYNRGTLTLTASSVYGNYAIDFGGGLENAGGRVWIDRSQVVYNVAVVGGGAGNDIGQMTVLNSTFAGNIGNGFYNRDALTLTNSTVSRNWLPPNSAYPYSMIYGSGLFNFGVTSTLNLNNVTLAGNGGSGIYQTSGSVNFKNTLLAGNLAGDCAGTLISQDYNLIQTIGGCTISGTTTHNVIGASPLLGFLQDNGGSTWTQPLLMGSPALDAGNPASPGSGGDACEAADQRGVTRPQGVACDIGASEGGYTAPADVVFTQHSSADSLGFGVPLSNSVAVGQPLTYTLVVTNVSGSVATGVRVTDTLPAEVVLASVSASLGSCGAGGGTVTCGPLSLNSGAVLTVTIALTPTKVDLLLNTVRVTTDATGATTVNTARVEPTSVTLLARDTQISLPIVTSGAIAWGDYDSDNDLDIALIGNTGSGRIAKIYRNDGNHVFTDIGAGLAGVDNGSLAWGDYDNDGDLDLLITGFDGANPQTVLYRNDGGGSFSNIAVGITGVQKGMGVWGDYDLDGDPDILLTGQSAFGPITKLYRNDGGGIFTDIGAALPGVYDSAAAWGDYDGDGNPDLLLVGYTGSTRVAKLYRNEGGGVFTDSGAGLYAQGIQSGTVAWADFDNDGDLDILLAGYDGCSAPACGGIYLYRNDGSGVFTFVGITVSYDHLTAAWGDYDNDGDPDIAQGSDYGVGMIYRNEGNGAFSDARANVFWNTIAWGDANKDGNLDMLAPGYGYPTSPPTTVFYNFLAARNTPPTTPTGLSITISDKTALLSWNASSDDHTPATGLTYNLRVGTTPSGSDIVSPMASSNGYRRIPAMGNVGQGLTATVQNLSPGTTYYWSVQAIDTAFAGSPFAGEGSFTVPGPAAVYFSSGTYTVSESANVAVITATVSAIPTQTITVSYTTGNGTALAGSDYLTATGTLTFDPGVTSATFTVPIIDDVLIEGNETVTLTLTNPMGALLGQPDSATLTIVDDDPIEYKLYLSIILR